MSALADAVAEVAQLEEVVKAAHRVVEDQYVKAHLDVALTRLEYELKALTELRTPQQRSTGGET